MTGHVFAEDAASVARDGAFGTARMLADAYRLRANAEQLPVLILAHNFEYACELQGRFAFLAREYGANVWSRGSRVVLDGTDVFLFSSLRSGRCPFNGVQYTEIFADHLLEEIE